MSSGVLMAKALPLANSLMPNPLTLLVNTLPSKAAAPPRIFIFSWRLLSRNSHLML